ncbi:MAG TPA: hypothetical protein VD998_01955 [Verrucomicrobiae bacterium]|nr:hypothetical protein [Verrucomicrobiae bacterium]
MKRIKNRFDNGDRSEADYKQELLLLDNSLCFFSQNISFYDYVLDNTYDIPVQTLDKIKEYIKKVNSSAHCG